MGESVNKRFKEASETEFAKETSERLKKAAENINKSTEPLRKNEYVGKLGDSFKTVVKDESGRYTGFVDKEARRKMREEAQKADASNPAKRTVAEDPNAGASIVIHKDSKWKESWNKFKEENPVMQGNKLYISTLNHDLTFSFKASSVLEETMRNRIIFLSLIPVHSLIASRKLLVCVYMLYWSSQSNHIS